MKIKINWNEIPNNYKYVAVDEDGEMLAYETKPEPRVRESWVVSYWNGHPFKYLGKVNLNNIDWRDTLTRRPAAKNQ